MRRKSVNIVMLLVLARVLALTGMLCAQVLQFNNIAIVTKVTSHPDKYGTGGDLAMSAPVVADLDSDFVLEIICAGYDEAEDKSSVYVWQRNGALREGWPVSVSGRAVTGISVGDLDADGKLEIILGLQNEGGDAGSVYAWRADGAEADGYPVVPGFVPGNLAVGDISDGFEDEVVYLEDYRIALAEFDDDGKKEIAAAGEDGIFILDGDQAELAGAAHVFIEAGWPVAGDIDNDGNPEIFFSADIGAEVKLYGYRYTAGALEELNGFPVDLEEVDNTDGAYLSLADINGDGVAEILSGSANGCLAAYNLAGSGVFFAELGQEAVYQPVVGDINNDGEPEIIASSASGKLHCLTGSGVEKEIAGWPEPYSFALSPGLVLVDIDQDSVGDVINPAGDLELLFSSYGSVHSIDLPGDFQPAEIQWGMSEFDNRGTGNWLADYNTAGWSVFDNDPDEAEIACVYDWSRGSRVIELDGAGLNNCYALMNPDGAYLNLKNTLFQWSMRYHLDFALYVSVDTTAGRHYLYYTPTAGDMLQMVDEGGKFIHHGLPDARDGKWHTLKRNLSQDLHDAYPDIDIIDINAMFVQGSGRIDDVLFLEGEVCAELENYAYSAALVEVSTGEADKANINDGDPATEWISAAEPSPWLQYSWDDENPLEFINKITLESIKGAAGGTIFITDAQGNVVELEFGVNNENMEIVFDSVADVVTVTVVFDTDGGSVAIGEIGVYYDPNYETDEFIDPVYTADDYIRLENGYFWNPQSNDGQGGYWLPRGIAYQTWVKDLGQWQSPVQLRNDLDGMQAVGANALRVDFVWKHIEQEDDHFEWDNYDLLLEEAQVRGLKVFPVIGYQWPPEWFPDDWYTKHPPCEAHPQGPWQSDILSYEHPEVRAEAAEYLQAVVGRYSVGGAREDLADTVAGWILGNEYGYMGLWSVEYDGYDDACQSAFRQWLEDRYAGSIGALNEQWAKDNAAEPGYLPGHPYADFAQVDMPIPFGYAGENAGRYLARDKTSWYDLTQWREESIGGYIALLAAAVKEVDENHLITYAVVGMQWGEEDWRYHTEDARKIVLACSAAGTPLDFWSINNYPWGLENDELMTGKWGIARARHDAGLPVMVTETGFTSTEIMYPGIDEERQALLVRNAVWETVASGAAGVCIFHWSDRDQCYVTAREVGFGVVDIEGNPKPVYTIVKKMFEQMDDIKIQELLPQFIDPAPDIALLWTDALDSIVNRFQAEMHNLFGTLKRLGFSPGFINREEMLAGDYSGYKAVVLSRNQKMSGDVLAQLTAAALGGVKIHVNADLPGIMDEYGVSRNTDPDWLFMLEDLFGIDTDASNLQIDPDLEDDDQSYGYYETASFSITYDARLLYSPLLDYNNFVNMWKYRDEIVAGKGAVLARFDDSDGSPALIVNDYLGSPEYDTAISLFSLGANKPIDNLADGASDWTWEDRYGWMRMIYTDTNHGFGLTPELIVSGSSLVLVDYLVTADLSQVLMSFKNYSPDTTETVQVSSALIVDKTVEDLLTGDLIAEKCAGALQHEIAPDGYSLFLAYEKGEGEENSDDGYEDEGEEDVDDPEQDAEEPDSQEEDEQDKEEDEQDDDEQDDDEQEDDEDDIDEEEEEDKEGDEEDNEQEEEQGDEQEEENEEMEQGDKKENNNIEENETQIINDDGDEEDESAKGYNYGYGSVYVLREKGERKSIICPRETAGAAGKPEKKPYSYYRSYLGRELYPDRDADLYEEEVVKVAPLPREQFKRRMEEVSYQRPGIIKITPRKVTAERKDEVMNREEQVKAPAWAAAFFKWLNNFVICLNSVELKRLVKHGWSRVRDGIQIASENKRKERKDLRRVRRVFT